MKKLLRVAAAALSALCFASTSQAQQVDITANPGTSGTPALGTSLYVANEAIYTDTEIGSSNFTTASTPINVMGLSVGTQGTNTTFNNVEIYFKDVPLTTRTFTSGTFTTTGYTLVFSGSITINSTGFTEFQLTNPYVRTPGTNLQVLITRSDATSHTGWIWNCANGNNVDGSTASSTRRYNGTTMLSGSTTLAVSAFRQAIRLKHAVPNDASVSNIYTLGKLPLPHASLQTISANITNQGMNTLTNIPVTLNISGAHNYNTTETIPSLAPGASAIVTFQPTVLNNTGTNLISVSIPADDDPSDDLKTLDQFANDNTWSYAYGPTPDGGVGFNGATGDFVARFNTSLATYLTQISVNFSNGGQPFKIGIWDASGPGNTPGVLLWESTQQISTSGLYVMPVVPVVALNAGDFFVGVRQVGTANVSFSFQSEIPIRPATFFYTSPSGNTSWFDFAPNSPFRFMIEPKLVLSNDVSLSALIINEGTNATCSNSNPQEVKAVIYNAGANPIFPGNASVTLKISGANTYTATLTNTNAIALGSTDTIVFTGLPLTNAGLNFDTAYVELPGDQEPLNDTARVTHRVHNTISALPFVEGFDGSAPAISYLTQLSGTGNWTLQLGAIDNGGLSDSLRPFTGNSFAMFDGYNFTAGTSSRLSSDCFELPAPSGGPCSQVAMSFWMSHDNSFPSNDDSLYLSVSTDAGATWNRIAGYQRYDASLTMPGWRKEVVDLSTYSGQTIRIGFEAVGKFGNLIAIDEITVGTLALVSVDLATSQSNNVNLQQTCDEGGWTYYIDPAQPSEYVLAINWDPGNNGVNVAAKTAAIPRIQVDAAEFGVTDATLQLATYTMRRYWNVDLGSATLTGPVNLRFFYDSTEVADVLQAVDDFIAVNGGTAETPTWFKTSTGDFENATTHMDALGVHNGVALNNTNSTNQRINGIPYAQFDGITSFSGGGFAAGVGAGTPLPLEAFLNISASRDGNAHRIDWEVPKADGIRQFVVQRSADGRNFQELVRIGSTGSTSYVHRDTHPVAGDNYYRVIRVDFTGKESYSAVVKIQNAGGSAVNLYPNPVGETLNVELFTAAEGKATVVVTDITGKTVLETNRNLSPGQNQFSLSVSSLTKGNYTVSISWNDSQVSQKFTVQ